MVQLRAPHGLEKDGIENPARVFWNLTTPALYEEAVRRREGLLAHDGPIVFHTGRHTSRSIRTPSTTSVAACCGIWRAKSCSSRTRTPVPTLDIVFRSA